MAVPAAAPVPSVDAKSETARVTWPAVADADNYHLTLNRGSTAIAQALFRTELWWVPDVTLVNGVQYTVVMTANNDDGSSVEARVQFTPEVGNGAAAPTMLVAAPGSELILLTYEKSAGADDYDVAHGTTNAFAAATKIEDDGDIGDVARILFETAAPANDATPPLPQAADGTPRLRVTLANQTAYFLWIRGKVSTPAGTDDAAWAGPVGPGAWAGPVNATPSDLTPMVPTITADHVRVGIDAATVSFEYLESATEGLDFDYRHRIGTAAWVEVTTAAGDPGHPDIPAPNFNITGLAGDTAYELQVRAKNVNGESGWSASLTFQTLAVPSGLSAQGGDEVLDLEWNANAAATDHDYRYREVTETAWQEVTDTQISGDRLRATGGFANGVTYELQLRARNAHSITYWTPSVVVTPVLPQEEFPTGLAADPGPAQIVSTWNRAINASGYDYRIREGMAGAWNVVSAGANTGVVITGIRGGPLVVGQLYQVAVRARNMGGGVSGWSDSVDVTPIASDLTDPDIISIRVNPRSGSLDVVLTLQNDLPGAVQVAARLDVQVPGGDFANAYDLPDDFVKAINVKGSVPPAPDPDDDEPFQPTTEQNTQTSPATDGNLLYTDLVNPLLVYLARDTEEQVRGAFVQIAALLLASQAARKWQKNIQMADRLFGEYQQQLVLALDAETAFVDVKAIKTEDITDVEEQR